MHAYLLVNKRRCIDLASKVVSSSSISCTVEEEAVFPPSKCTSLYQTETLSLRLASTVVFRHFRFYLAKERSVIVNFTDRSIETYLKKCVILHITRSPNSLFDFRFHFNVINIETIKIETFTDFRSVRSKSS